MDIVNSFWDGLLKVLPEESLQQLKHGYGATLEHIELLKSTFPDCPQSLISLLEKIDGTYYRKYGEEEVSIYILGSDIFEYPYHLLSVEQMLESSKEHEDTSYILQFQDEDNFVDPRIKSEGLIPGTYIHFSDCMNNGGSSRLYIDFNPSAEGVSGQIVRFLHDPDQYKVIADSFDEYLNLLIEEDYQYIVDFGY